MKKRTNKKKPVLARNLMIAFVVALFVALGRMVAWLSAAAYRGGRKNPLAATGCLLFVGAFSYIAFNALFSQTEKHHAPLFDTRDRPVAGSNHINSSQTVAQNQEKPAASAPLPAPAAPQKPAQDAAAFNLDTMTQDDIIALQTKLAGLGLYDSTIDGLKGPKTRAALEAWKNSTLKSNTVKSAARQSPSHDDDIASLIAATPAADHVTTNAIAKPQADNHGAKASVADILRVQAGLRAFGASDVKMTGEEDIETEKALRVFQKMFSLEETGKINPAVLKKMQEIGLFG